MELLLIRHGESEADLIDVHEGRADFSLTEKGVIQATMMATYVAENYPPELILSSPLKRAKQTAEILNEKLSVPLLMMADLMEYNNGVLAGLDREEAKRKYPLSEGGRPVHIPIEEGESQLDFRHRVEQVYFELIHNYREQNRIAIVSHGGFISNFFRSMLQLPVTTNVIFPTGDTGIHLVEINNKNENIIRFMNNQSHLN